MTRKKSESEVLHQLAAWCSMSEKCCNDARQRAAKQLDDPAAIERIIRQLLEQRFIDETRYARAFVNDKFKYNRWGRIKIDIELRQKQINSEIRSEALDTIDDSEYKKTLLSLLTSKQRSVKAKDSYDKRTKLMRFAIGRGFEINIISCCLDKLKQNDDDYDDEMDQFDSDYDME